MKKTILFILFAFSFNSLRAASDTAKVEPTSEIPKKREFPLNTEVNPCEDFHKYVCSIAESRFKLRDDRRRHMFAFNDSDERLLEAKKKFMKNLPKEKSLSKRGQQAKSYYNSCMDTKSRAEEEKAKLKKIQSDLNASKDIESFVTYLHSQTKKGEYSFFSFWANANVEEPLKLDLQMYSNVMDLPDHTYYEKPEVMKAYQALLTDFFQTVDPKMSAEEAGKRADKQVTLQKEFIKVFPVANIRRQRWAEKRTATQEDLIKKYPNLNLQEIYKETPATTLVNVPIPEGIEFFDKKMTESELNTLKDFYLLQSTSSMMDEGFPKFFQSQFDFEKNYFGGPQVRSDLQERCTEATSRTFTMEVDQILTDRLFPGFKDSRVQELAGKIRTSIVKGLEKNDWLSPESKAGAIRKISTAKLQLVRPHTDKEWDFLPIQKYTGKYLENKRIYGQARFQKNMEDLKHPANQESWGMGPLTVNAYYSPNENKFVLPIGILQYPFYDKDGDMLENLGAVGAVVGHELGHSIDDQGSKYDADGKLKDWMSMKDKAEFSKRGQKMIALFNKAGHDGSLTQGENVADLVGLTFAYQAAFPDGNGKVEDKKRFFASYARVWCNVSRPDFDQVLLKTDPHAAGWARINEQVKHQAAFAESFQCKSGDKMYLSEKDRVKVW